MHRKAYDKAEIKYSASPSNLLSHLKTGLPEHREAWEYLQRRKATAKLRLKAGAKTDAAGGGKGWGSGGRGLRGGRGGSGDGGGDGGGAGGGGDGYVFGLSEALEKSEGVKKKPLMMVSEYFPPKTPAWEQRLVRWMVQTAQPLSVSRIYESNVVISSLFWRTRAPHGCRHTLRSRCDLFVS